MIKLSESKQIMNKIRLVSKYIFILSFIVFARPAFADWVYLQDVPQSGYKVQAFIERQIQTNGKYKTISILNNFDRLYEDQFFGFGTKYRSSVSTYEFDCSSKQYRRLSWKQYSGFMATGLVAWSDEKASNWKDVWTGSMFGIVMNIGTYYKGVCQS